ncbi:hypothetical protein B0H16DRAFT_1888548 [Mycena metata]|uniref:MYND-type domain-containing protein n=1 Tax=Mycena metata TaxID=1033252 RepID=A0AAD7IQ01_9AGAR|nr:hypothetical protein B0H16DRAFT_1888548 [Mycena metata]
MIQSLSDLFLSVHAPCFGTWKYSSQKRALKALNGSYEDLLYLLRTENKNKLLLPVFCAHLDPEKAPDLQEELTFDQAKAVVMASIAFQALDGHDQKDIPPPGAMLELWPGVWKWAQIVVQHDYCLVYLPRYHTGDIFIAISWVIEKFYWEKPVAKLIDAEPGVRVFVAKMWALYLRPRAPERGGDGIISVWRFLALRVDLSNPSHLADLVEGSGGTLTHLAMLTANYVPHLLPMGRPAHLLYLYSTAAFMFRVQVICPEFNAELLSQGIIRLFTHSLCHLITPEDSMPADNLDQCVQMLLTKLETPPGYTWLIEALDAGFLRLIAAAVINPQIINTEIVLQAFTHILGPHLLHHSVVSKLGTCLQVGGLGELVEREASKTSPLWEKWNRFTTLLAQRLRLIQVYQSDQYTATNCRRIVSKSNLRRCSVCQSAWYCCLECQTADWRRGHKQFCRSIRMDWAANPAIYSSHNRSFARFLLETFYDYFLPKILLTEALSSASCPSDGSSTCFRNSGRR